MFTKGELFKIWDGLTSEARHIRRLMADSDNLDSKALSSMDSVASGYERVAQKAKDLLDEQMKGE